MSTNPLFPLYGIILGQTTIKELAALGSRSEDIHSETQKPYQYFRVNGMNFWFGDKYASHIYITRSDVLPTSWRDAGFSWKKSFIEWIKVLNGMQCTILVKKEPEIEEYRGHPSFFADIVGILNNDPKVEISLSFAYSKGTTVLDNKTLYSIGIKY